MAKETFRKARRNGYTTIQNSFLDDSGVTLQGKGFMAILLSNTNDWEINMKDIISRSKNGRDAHYDVVWHLIERGYYARIYVREKGKYKEIFHVFGDVKDDVKTEMENIVSEMENYGYQCSIEYMIKKPSSKKAKSGKNVENADVEPITENQETVNNQPFPENPYTVYSDTDFQYNNNNNIENNNNNKNNMKNHNLNLEQDILDILWETELPMKLKRWIKVKINDNKLNIDSEQLLLIEEAYKYQINKGMIVPNCERDSITAINDDEFSGSIAKMLDTVNDIQNMKGLVQSWVNKAYEFKVDNLSKPFYDRGTPFYNWLDE